MNIDLIKSKLLADKKKLGVMLALAAVASVMWGRLLLKNGPKTAVATIDRVVTEVVVPDHATARTDEPKLRARPTVLIDEHGPVARDLFAFDASFYKAIDGGNATVQSSEKSGPDSSDENAGRRAAEMAVHAAASGLKLQTTVLGQRNRAMINGELLEEGQTIQGFELTEVRSRSVRLAKDGVEVTLEM